MGIKTGRKGSPMAGSDYFISLRSFNGAEFPEYVLVRYAPQATTDREQAPSPSNGFVCDGSPFDRGHVCALELGGPDISENIVPQWRHWQETGEWRRLESVDIPANASPGDLLLFRVIWRNDLVFAVEPPQVDITHYQAFGAESLIGWDDFRIPRQFKFWLIRPSHPAYAALSAGLGTADLTAGIQAFLAQAALPLFERAQEQMPAEDHAQLERQQVLNATHEFMEVMEQVHERRIVSRAEKLMGGGGKLTRRQADVEARKLLGDFQRAKLMAGFDAREARLFRKLLIARFNFDATESGHFTPSRILAGHGGSYPKVAVKRLRTRPEALDFRKRRGATKAREKAHALLVSEADSPDF